MKIFKCIVESEKSTYAGMFAIVAASSKASAKAIISERLLGNDEKESFKVVATLMRNGNDVDEKVLVVVDEEYKEIGVEA